MKTYDYAVDYIERVVRGTEFLWNDPNYPGIANQVEYCFKVLKEIDQYSNRPVIN